MYSNTTEPLILTDDDDEYINSKEFKDMVKLKNKYNKKKAKIMKGYKHDLSDLSEGKKNKHKKRNEDILKKMIKLDNDSVDNYQKIRSNESSLNKKYIFYAIFILIIIIFVIVIFVIFYPSESDDGGLFQEN